MPTQALAVPNGTVAQSAEDFDQALATLPSDKSIVVKAQIHAGGRGKGTFKDGFQGGVHVVSSAEDAKAKAEAMLGNVLVTKQTGEAGKEVSTIYFNEATDIEKEYYLAILMDRATSQPVIIASTEGGMDIEEVAEKTPEKILKVLIDPTLGIRPYQARQVAFGLELKGDSFKQCVKLVTKLYAFFWAKDCSQVEVNPLVTTPDGDVLALDAKVNFDSNALFRHPGVVELRDLTEEDPKEVEASKFDLNYIALGRQRGLHGQRGRTGHGHHGHHQALRWFSRQFPRRRRGATEEQVENAFRILVADDAVKAILVNIFGGIMKCDVIATGIVNAARNLELNVPLVVRLEGTNVEEGKKILADSGLALEPADSLAEAAEKVVKLAAESA